MKTLEQLAQSLTEIARLPEAVQKARQEQFGNIQALGATVESQGRKVALMEQRQSENHAAAMNAIMEFVAQEIKEATFNQPQHASPFEFILENDGDGFADASWESIIDQGQKLQEQYYRQAETFGVSEYGAPPANSTGWYGTAESPIIIIKCIEPVYRFKNTARLPGRFQVRGNGHWSSFLRFYGTGDKVLKDTIPWGVATDAPIGIYVEPVTELTDGRTMRNFEQAIQGVMLIGHRGSMPVYISQNAFNFRMTDCNVQCHQGAQISIKHGPAIEADWYPVKQVYPPNYQSVYLPDPVFSNMLIEGQHKFKRKSCGILASGNNMIFDRLNFYGHMCGLMLHGGQGRIVSNCTMHDGATGDGRHWVAKEHLVLAHLITDQSKGKNKDGISGNCDQFPIHVIERGQPAPAGGWFNGGEVRL